MCVQEIPDMDEAAFYEMHNTDQMAVDKLKEGIDGFTKVRGHARVAHA
jgi:transaldolase